MGWSESRTYIIEMSTIYDFHSTPWVNIYWNWNYRRFFSKHWTKLTISWLMRRMFLKDNLPYPPLIQEITILEVVIKISGILSYNWMLSISWYYIIGINQIICIDMKLMNNRKTLPLGNSYVPYPKGWYLCCVKVIVSTDFRGLQMIWKDRA